MSKSKHSEVQILLIEDNKADAILTKRALRKVNLANNLIHLSDGAEALDYIFGRGEYQERNPKDIPRVIFLDLKMPKVNGLEVLKEIKSNEKTKIIPVVVMTSSQEESDLIASFKLGVNSYVVKPVDFEKFSETIVQLGLYWMVVNKTP